MKNCRDEFAACPRCEGTGVSENLEYIESSSKAFRILDYIEKTQGADLNTIKDRIRYLHKILNLVAVGLDIEKDKQAIHVIKYIASTLQHVFELNYSELEQ